jgi:SET domain-containing protein
MAPYLKRTWVNPKLVSAPSPIHGDGVFASAPIGAGEPVMDFGGEMVTQDRLANYRERSVWEVKRGLYLALPNTDTEDSLDEHLNHSCDANTWLVDETKIVARRDIGAGEEITLDQGTWNFDEAEYAHDGTACSCGARNCRGVLTENDWKRADVQESYRGHFHPLVQKMIDAGRRR